MDDTQDIDENEEVNMLNLEEHLNRGSEIKMAKGSKEKHKKKDHMYQFVEWNFQKRAQKAKKLRLRKEHPSF